MKFEICVKVGIVASLVLVFGGSALALGVITYNQSKVDNSLGVHYNSNFGR